MVNFYRTLKPILIRAPLRVTRSTNRSDFSRLVYFSSTLEIRGNCFETKTQHGPCLNRFVKASIVV